jgi:hypothetical protein
LALTSATAGPACVGDLGPPRYLPARRMGCCGECLRGATRFSGRRRGVATVASRSIHNGAGTASPTAGFDASAPQYRRRRRAARRYPQVGATVGGGAPYRLCPSGQVHPASPTGPRRLLERPFRPAHRRPGRPIGLDANRDPGRHRATGLCPWGADAAHEEAELLVVDDLRESRDQDYGSGRQIDCCMPASMIARSPRPVGSTGSTTRR